MSPADPPTGAAALHGRPRTLADGRTSRDASYALWLGVAGIGIGFLLMFLVLTPAAIVYGTRALRAIRVDPRLVGRGRAITGIVLAVVAPLLWVGLFVGFLVDGIG